MLHTILFLFLFQVINPSEYVERYCNLRHILLLLLLLLLYVIAHKLAIQSWIFFFFFDFNQLITSFTPHLNTIFISFNDSIIFSDGLHSSKIKEETIQYDV